MKSDSIKHREWEKYQTKKSGSIKHRELGKYLKQRKLAVYNKGWNGIKTHAVTNAKHRGWSVSKKYN